jgi:phosphoglycolate phosphatase-like HAD superfamily hydrolase
VLGLDEIDTEWGAYEHVTDTGIALELLRRHGRELPSASDLERVRSRFFALLEADLAGAGLTEVPGAAAALRSLRADPDWSLAIATGCWGGSARIKLRAAGLPVEGLPLASSDDAISRFEIVRTAISRARSELRDASGGPSFERVVLLGDREWDARAAAAHGLPLVGIACEGSRRALSAAGVRPVLDDYGDLERFRRALAEAEVPRQPELDALVLEQVALHLLGAGDRARAQLAARVHDALPRNVPVVRERVQRVAHLPRVAWQPGETGDLAVGRHPTAGDALHDGVDALVARRHEASECSPRIVLRGTCPCRVRSRPARARKPSVRLRGHRSTSEERT